MISGLTLLRLSLAICGAFFYLRVFNEVVLEWEAFSYGGVRIILLVLFDWVRAIFLRTVLLIAGAVIVYRRSYMGGDKFRSRFCLLVLSFVIRIGILIISPRIVSLLLG